MTLYNQINLSPTWQLDLIKMSTIQKQKRNNICVYFVCVLNIVIVGYVQK